MVQSQAMPRHVVLEMPSQRHSILPLHPLAPLSAKGTVAVLITSYNYGRFLNQSIDSVLDQAYPFKEVIVSDDGSQDNSCDIVESYIQKGAPVKLVRGQHQGMAGSMNAAFRASTADIVCFLDADDYFLPGKLAAVVAAFRAHPNSGFAVNRAQMVDNHNRNRGVYPLLSSLPEGNCMNATLQNAGILMGLPPTSNLSLRREIAELIFPLPLSFTGYAEQVIHRIAPLMTSLCAVDEPLSVWRLHGKNDGNSSKVASGRMDRELNFMRDLWFEQRNYLMSRNPEAAKHLPALESNQLYMKMRYMQLKLLGNPAAKEAHVALCALLSPEQNSIPDRFWRNSLYLPRPIFQKCVNLLQTQSIWKEWIARLAKRRRAA